jgi:ribosomal protein S18 acetylase RimI-like enzyme
MPSDIRRIVATDDLEAICAQMTPEGWGKDNEMTRYDPASLKVFLEHDNYLVLAYDGDKIAGAAIASVVLHPSKNSDSLFINEVDTHPDYRRQGIAMKLMEELLAISRERKLSEAWVGADEGNTPAHELYKKLNPYELDPNTIYGYKTDQ